MLSLPMICITCRRRVMFGLSGWEHRDLSPECPKLIVAWPPPVSDEGDETDDFAAHDPAA